MKASELYRILESKRKPTQAFLHAIRKEFLSANWKTYDGYSFKHKMPFSRLEELSDLKADDAIGWLTELGYNVTISEDTPCSEMSVTIECRFSE